MLYGGVLVTCDIVFVLFVYCTAHNLESLQLATSSKRMRVDQGLANDITCS